MIKIENVEVTGWQAALRGMRNPKDSWDKSDTVYCDESCGCCKYYSQCQGLHWDVPSANFCIGEADLNLATKLAKGGSAHAKYKRMINVHCDITSNHTWWAEFDTYEHTVRNSCSKMHRIHVKPFDEDMFSHEGVTEVGGYTEELWKRYIEQLEFLRVQFNETQDKKYWRAIIDMLPMGFNLKATVMLNYEVLTAIYRWRRNHKMFEWVGFCEWIESLPYSEIITAGVK